MPVAGGAAIGYLQNHQMSEGLIVVITTAAGTAGYFIQKIVDHFFGRQKAKAEEEAEKLKQKSDEQSHKLDLAVKNLDYYQGMVDDLGKRLFESYQTIKGLENQHRELLKDYAALDANHRELMSTNQYLVEELQKYKQLNGKMP